MKPKQQKFQLYQVLELAQGIEFGLRQFCQRVDIAGSIRRKCVEVSDIEIVALPIHSKMGMMENWLKGLGSAPPANKPKPFRERRYVKLHLHHLPIQLDLFIPQAHDYGRQLAIRTGSAEYSAKVLAHRWVKMGWVGTQDGLRRRDQCQDASGVWKLLKDVKNPTLPPEFPDETSFFEFLGLEWVEPERRNYR